MDRQSLLRLAVSLATSGEVPEEYRPWLADLIKGALDCGGEISVVPPDRASALMQRNAWIKRAAQHVHKNSCYRQASALAAALRGANYGQANAMLARAGRFAPVPRTPRQLYDILKS